MTKKEIKEIERDQKLLSVLDTLDEILESIKAENISYGEIVYLTAHKREIKKYYPDEPLLWQWSGIDEAEYNKK